MPRFKATRNFLRSPGVVVLEGAVLELDDDEARLLVMLQAVEPVDARDRKRMVTTANIVWKHAVDMEPLERTRRAGYIG